VFPDEFGLHFLCSDQPIARRSAKDLLEKMPAAAVADLAEWDLDDGGSAAGAATVRLNGLLSQETTLDPLIAASPNTPALTDDRPINEYYVLGGWLGRRVLDDDN
jgi:hypothetical protein